MLYYLSKFFKLLKQQPLQVFAHIRSLYEQWSDNRRGQVVNEVLSYLPSFLAINECPQQLRGLGCNQILCLHGHVKRILFYLNNAKYSIDLAMYGLHSVEFSAALVAAAKRGVRVRIVTQTEWTESHKDFSDIAVCRMNMLTDRLMHNKFCVIDGYQRMIELLPKGAKPPLAICLTGSLNWVSYGENFDNVLVTSAPKICRVLEQEFEHMWNIGVAKSCTS